MEVRKGQDGSIVVSLEAAERLRLYAGKNCVADEPMEGTTVFVTPDKSISAPEVQFLGDLLGVYLPADALYRRGHGVFTGDIGRVEESPLGQRMLSIGAVGVVVRATGVSGERDRA